MKAVNVNMKDVKKASMQALRQDAPPSFVLVLAGEGPIADPASSTADPLKEPNMSVLVYILLTVAIFGLLGLVQKLVEGL